MSNKKMAIALIALSAAMGLAACGGKSSSSTNTATTGTTTATATSTVPVVTDVSIVNGWQDNGDSVYTPSVASDVLTVAYAKAGAGWAAMKYSMGRVASQLAGYKKLVMKFKVTGHTGTGPMTILPKFEFNDKTAHPAHECKFQFSETEVTYEWDLSDQVLTDALQLLVFVEPDCGITSGSLVFSKLYFSKDAVAASGTTIVGKGFTPIVNTYASGDTFNTMKNFYDGGDYAYKITEAATEVDVAYSKWGNSYSYFGAIADNVSTFKYVNLVVEGPKDKTMLMKVENSNSGAVIKEQTVTFTGAAQDFTYYFKNNVGLTGQQKINFFAEPGSTTVSSGTIKITKLEFSNTALVAEPVVVTNPYAGMNPWDKTTAVNNWKDGGDAKFTVEAAANKTTVSWKDQALTQSWSSVQAPLSGDYSHMTQVALNLTASGATKMLCKIQGSDIAVEQWVTFTAEKLTQDVVIDLSSKTQANRLSENLLLIFPLSGDDGLQLATGSVIINSAAFTTPMVPVLNAAGDSYDCLNGIYGPANYSFTRSTTVKVDYTEKKGEWEAMGFALDPAADYSAFTKLVLHVDAATAGIKLKFKINNKEEYNADDLTGTADITLNITTAIAAASKSFVSCFVNYGVTGVAGSVTFSKLALTK
jgi:hypothetical protein